MVEALHCSSATLTLAPLRHHTTRSYTVGTHALGSGVELMHHGPAAHSYSAHGAVPHGSCRELRASSSALHQLSASAFPSLQPARARGCVYVSVCTSVCVRVCLFVSVHE